MTRYKFVYRQALREFEAGEVFERNDELESAFCEIRIKFENGAPKYIEKIGSFYGFFSCKQTETILEGMGFAEKLIACDRKGERGIVSIEINGRLTFERPDSAPLYAEFMAIYDGLVCSPKSAPTIDHQPMQARS